jgi:large subunit ribosomal protein L10
MKTKEQKQASLKRLRSQFDDCPAIVVCKFEGLKVAEDQQLRGALRSIGGRYQVVSNRLAHRAAMGTPFQSTLAGQRGMTALAFPGEDLIGSLKALVQYARAHASFTFTAGVVEGRTLDVDQLNALSRMPGKEGLHAQLLYMINSSAQRLMGVLNAPARDIAAVVQQAVEEKKFNE